MKRQLVMLLCAVLLVSLVYTPAASAKEETAEKDALSQVKSAVLIEKDTGKVLFEKNMNEKLPPASMTKMMTMLLIFKALDENKLDLKEKVNTSEHAASMGGSQIFLEPGEKMTVDDLLKGIAIASANDASTAMAEHLAGGSEKAFVKQMNQTVKTLGLSHTHFNNPTGLPADGHFSSAYDMAMIARGLLHYQDVLKYTSKYEDYLRQDSDKPFWLVNTNKLLKSYEGVDGLKTGFTQKAKYCLTATGSRDGMRLIAVVMGAPTYKVRNKAVTELLDYGFSNYSTKKVADGNQFVRQVPVEKSVSGNAKLYTKDPVVLLLKRGEKAGHFKTRIKVDKKLHAPIKKGTTVGYYEIVKDGKTVSSTPLVTREKTKEAGFWDLFKRQLSRSAAF